MACPCHPEIEEGVRAHLPVVHRVLRGCGLRPGESGYDDAYSDGQLALWQALERYDPARMGLEDFLQMWVRSRIRNGLRDRSGAGRARATKSPSPLAVWHDPAEELRDVEREIELGDDIRRLLELAARLHPTLPTIIALLRDGHTQSEVAQALGVHHSTVGRRLRLLTRYAETA